MIESALFEILSANVGVSALVAEASSPIRYRIYPLLIPQHELGDLTQIPCIVYTKVGAARSVRYAGTDNLVQATFQIDAYSSSYSASASLAEAIRSALVDYNGTAASIKVITANIDNEFALDDPEPGLFRISQNWVIWFVE